MAEVKYVQCPNCKQKQLGPYTISTSTKSKTSGTCSHCGKRYTIEYGQGKIKASKG